MKSPLRTSVVVVVLAGLVLAGLVAGRAVAARRAFDRESAFARPLDFNTHYKPNEDLVRVAWAAQRVPRTTAILGRLAMFLQSDDYWDRMFAATIISQWDVPARADGLLPRPEHHARPVEELLPLLPAIASAQRSRDDLGEVVDFCLVTVWDETTIRQFIEHDARRVAPDKHAHDLHRELAGILCNEDPRPVTKDGFSGLVYGYATDEQVRARFLSPR